MRDKAVALGREAAARVDTDKLRDLIRRLVQIPSVWDPEVPGSGEGQVACFCEEYLKKLGLTVYVEEAAPGRPNVIADWTPGGEAPSSEPVPTLILEGHLDVVSVGDADAWRYPPFSAAVEDEGTPQERIYGRGTADMKAGVAAAIIAVEAVKAAAEQMGVVPAGRVRLALLADEEGMMQGVRAFVKRGWAEGAVGAIVCEPEENEVCLVQKGGIRAGYRVLGVMAHGAMPDSGVNPLPAAAYIVQALTELDEEFTQRLGRHPLLGRPSVTPTVLRAPASGPHQLNVMGPDVELWVDIRTVPGLPHDEVVQRLEGIAQQARDRFPRCEIALDIIDDRPTVELEADHPFAQAVAEAVALATEREPVYGGVPGATDGTFLNALGGVPVVVIGPGPRYIPHQKDEYVETQQVVEAARIYAHAIPLVLGVRKEQDA